MFVIFFLFLIIMGPIILFFGKKYFRYLIGLTGLLLGGGLALTMIYASDQLSEGTIGLYFISLLIIAVSGSFVGFVLSTFLFVGLCVACGFSGVIAGDLVYNLVFIGLLPNLILFIVLIASLGTLAVVGAYYKRVFVTILSTSLIGSFFFVRGLAYFIGGYTDELTLYKNLVAGTGIYSYTFLAYLAVILILGAIGFGYQTKHDDEPKVEDEEDKKDEYVKV
jgi:hypothetical protein